MGWGPLRSPFVLPSTETRATTRVPTHPITTPAPTGTRGLLPKNPIPERGADLPLRLGVDLCWIEDCSGMLQIVEAEQPAAIVHTTADGGEGHPLAFVEPSLAQQLNNSGGNTGI